MTTGQASRAARLRRRVGYLGATVEARRLARPGPAPTDDAGWAALLRHWLELQVERLAADVDADLAHQPTPSPDLLGRARRLWSLAHLRRHGIGGDRVATVVPRAWEALDRHVDQEHGGWVWTIDPSGAVTDGRKVLTAECMAVYALAEVALLGGPTASRARAEAEAAFAVITGRTLRSGAPDELYARDRTSLPSGTVHAHAHAVAGTTSIDSLLHLFEAAALLAVAGGDGGARPVADGSAALLHERFLGPGAVVRIDEGGRPLAAPVSLGHEIEAAWLLAEHADALGLDGERDRCHEVVAAALAAGFHHGAQDDSPDPGFRPGGRQRVWWVQTELARALVELDDGPAGRHREILLTVLRWLHRRQVDPRTGQAWQLMTHWGLVLVTGADTTARTGYHDIRAYVAAADLLDPADGPRKGSGGHR